MTKILFLTILLLKYLEIPPFSSESPNIPEGGESKKINLSPSSHSSSKSLSLLRVAGMGSIPGTGDLSVTAPQPARYAYVLSPRHGIFT